MNSARWGLRSTMPWPHHGASFCQRSTATRTRMESARALRNLSTSCSNALSSGTAMKPPAATNGVAECRTRAMNQVLSHTSNSATKASREADIRIITTLPAMPIQRQRASRSCIANTKKILATNPNAGAHGVNNRQRGVPLPGSIS